MQDKEKSCFGYLDISPSATTVETTTVAAETSSSAIASTSAQEVAPPPSEEGAKSSRWNSHLRVLKFLLVY